MPITLTIIIPIIVIMRNVLIPDKSIFVVQPMRAVAVNVMDVMIKALLKRATPDGIAATTLIKGAIVSPVIKAKRANKNLFNGTFVLHVLAVKISASSAIKRTYINPGVTKKYCKRYSFPMNTAKTDIIIATAKKNITLPKNVGLKPACSALT